MTVNTNQIRKLPVGWASAEVDELLSSTGLFCDGDWVETKDQDPNGNVRLIQLADIGDGIFKDKSNRYLTFKKSIELGCTYLSKEDLLIARLPDPLGRACIFPLDGEKKYVTVVDICIVRTGSGNINNKYLLFLFNSPQLRTEIDKYKSGSTRKRISRKNLAKIELPIASNSEQNQIVEKIEELFSELDNGIENLKKAREQLKTYRQAVLKYAFEGKLTEEWRNRQVQAGNPPEPAEKLLERIKIERENYYQKQLAGWKKECEQAKKEGKKKPAKPKKLRELPPLSEDELAELPQIPIGWCWGKLGNVVSDICLGKMLDKEKNKGVYQPYLRNINVRWNCFDLSDLLEMRFESNENKRYGLKKGDLIICEGGEPGRSAIWKESVPGMNIQKALHRVRFFENTISNKYVLNFIFYSSLNGHLSKFFTGTTIKHLTGKGLSNFVIPALSYSEQKIIVQEIESRLSVCDKLEQIIEDSLQKSEALRQSILKKAFSGELTKDWREKHPELISGENSAEKLLERIKADKEKLRHRKTKKK